ncbi:putative amino acid transporter [Rhizodiscina lignyota]|uniref:Amino acid transporter n=1 Tax=Rhizodiscina lignyota TaxID=1504668 RepID=A0A9P4IC22_9PEZI|nr:putative amino acid transporter [Rhizodiscina lignyota]
MNSMPATGSGLPDYGEKGVAHDIEGKQSPVDSGNVEDVQEGGQKPLVRALHDRHMQVRGGAIGAGLFVGSGSTLNTGGPASLVLGYIIVGTMLLLTVQALAEMAVLYPVNGAFYNFICRFMDPSWGFALGWDYAIGWLVILPFEITAASITIDFWRSDINVGVWIAVFLTVLAVVQVFGVRGYGEVEFTLSIIKVIALIGFIIFAIIVDCGGVPTDHRGYIGAHYWHKPGAFRNGFKGFCSVFVTAAFAFGGTELTGLAAAEAADPRKSIPKATRQVFWRIAVCYIISTFMLGLIVPSDSDVLLNSTGANTKASPFVLAITLAGVKGLPSVMNAVITISVLSVANSATFGSTRTLQALALQGMAPKLFAYVDKHGRPLPVVILQLLFGLLAFINEANVGSQVFNWLLALSGLSNFFIWGSICVAHIRFRRAWAVQGRDLKQIPYKAFFGVWGSTVGAALNFICLIAQFYIAVWPIGGSPGGTAEAQDFFEAFLAAPVILGLYLGWKLYSGFSRDPKVNHRGWRMYWRAEEIDLDTGMREGVLLELDDIEDERRGSVTKQAASIPYRMFRALF